MLICITGLPGTGKSLVAELLKQELETKGRQVRHYTTDWVRFKLYPHLADDQSQHGRDFTQDELERTYNGLYMLLGELFDADPALAVITDGTYRKESQRQALRQIAARHSVPFTLIKVGVDEEKLLARLRRRLEAGEVCVVENTGDTEALKEKVRRLAGLW